MARPNLLLSNGNGVTSLLNEWDVTKSVKQARKG